MTSFARRIAWAILILRLAYFDVLEILRAESINDYASFHAAATAIREGLDPYDLGDLQQAARIARLPPVHPYFYPPLLAELARPCDLVDPVRGASRLDGPHDRGDPSAQSHSFSAGSDGARMRPRRRSSSLSARSRRCAPRR